MHPHLELSASTGWQPIGSAPRNEVPVLLYVPVNTPSRRILAAYHVEGEWWILSGSVVLGKPSHWMPLPSPPHSNGERQ